MEKKARMGKLALQKALKERLDKLTLSLGEAEVGGKGIELIKEMKELCALLENPTGRESQSLSKSAVVPLKMNFTWIMPQEKS